MRSAAALTAATLGAVVLAAPGLAFADPSPSPSPAYPPATGSPSPTTSPATQSVTVTVTVSPDGTTVTVTVKGYDPNTLVTVTVTVTSTSKTAFRGQALHVIPAAFAAGSTVSKKVMSDSSGVATATFSASDFGLSTFDGSGTIAATTSGTRNGVPVTSSSATVLPGDTIVGSTPTPTDNGSAAASPVTTSSGSLPFTGATAIVPTAIVGVLLVGAGATAIVGSRRRERSNRA